jgi:hypothetical protein
MSLTGMPAVDCNPWTLRAGHPRDVVGWRWNSAFASAILRKLLSQQEILPLA